MPFPIFEEQTTVASILKLSFSDPRHIHHTSYSEMYLKKALWTDGLTAKSSAESSPENQSALATSSAVGELVNTLNHQRLSREVTFALRTGLRDASAEFSFLRVLGLRSLLKSLRSIAQSNFTIELFCQTQSVPTLQVVPVLFQQSLQESEDDPVVNLDNIFGVEPLRIVSPSTDAEVGLALRALEGCCLLHRESAALAHRHKAIPVLMNILSIRGVLERGACKCFNFSNVGFVGQSNGIAIIGIFFIHTTSIQEPFKTRVEPIK